LAGIGSPLANQGKKSKGDDGATFGQRIARLKEQLLEEQVRKLRHENDRNAGKLIDHDEAKIEVSEWFGQIRDRLRRLPEDVGVEVPAEVKVLVISKARRVVDLLFDEIAGWESRGFES
jgi:hypothetical protein